MSNEQANIGVLLAILRGEHSSGHLDNDLPSDGSNPPSSFISGNHPCEPSSPGSTTARHPHGNVALASTKASGQRNHSDDLQYLQLASADKDVSPKWPCWMLLAIINIVLVGLCSAIYKNSNRFELQPPIVLEKANSPTMGRLLNQSKLIWSPPDIPMCSITGQTLSNLQNNWAQLAEWIIILEEKIDSAVLLLDTMTYQSNPNEIESAHAALEALCAEPLNFGPPAPIWEMSVLLVSVLQHTERSINHIATTFDQHSRGYFADNATPAFSKPKSGALNKNFAEQKGCLRNELDLVCWLRQEALPLLNKELNRWVAVQGMFCDLPRKVLQPSMYPYDFTKLVAVMKNASSAWEAEKP
ncbi:hypothetical protein BT63DRAFT_421056 [Microthyrium microscopicum]|uniref:Uncharacterized protein n=1 Tax=Microthyrium microscopicum TaxID=703497 RepID=A0A6A6UKV2_9PEZI|nr:hypothetical protein BT63DRAFT_421056 [Microthyrium microscopicum]